jgi:hypothetical protein
MNIAKHKEILALREDFMSLQQEYIDMQAAAVDHHSALLLTAAVQEFIEYVRAAGFEVTGDENGTLKAILDGIVISLDRKPRIFTVYMPNGEKYPVSIQTTLEYKVPSVPTGLSQDAEIVQIKKNIETVKAQFPLIETQQFRYILSTESNNQYTGITYGRQIFLTFNDILSVMFS